jgi:hypothetical protein
MALNINIPQPSQTLAQTQLDIKDNFIFINTGFSVDHVEFNVTGAGKHNKITFPVQSPAPVFVDVGDIGLFSFIGSNSFIPTNKNELNVYKDSNTGYVNVPFTASILSDFTPTTGSTGWSYLPSGLIIRWGKATINITLNTVVTTNVTFAVDFPNRLLNVQITQEAPNSSDLGIFYSASPVSAHSFNVCTFKSINTPGATCVFSYFAIGY